MRVFLKCCEGIISFEGDFAIYIDNENYRIERIEKTEKTKCAFEYEIGNVIIETKDARYTIMDCQDPAEMIRGLAIALEIHRNEEHVVLDIYDPLGDNSCYDNGAIICERL